MHRGSWGLPYKTAVTVEGKGVIGVNRNSRFVRVGEDECEVFLTPRYVGFCQVLDDGVQPLPGGEDSPTAHGRGDFGPFVAVTDRPDDRVTVQGNSQYTVAQFGAGVVGDG